MINNKNKGALYTYYIDFYKICIFITAIILYMEYTWSNNVGDTNGQLCIHIFNFKGFFAWKTDGAEYMTYPIPAHTFKVI